MWYRAKEAVEKLTGTYILMSIHSKHCHHIRTLDLRSLVDIEYYEPGYD